jgi:hypothetical protein
MCNKYHSKGTYRESRGQTSCIQQNFEWVGEEISCGYKEEGN